MAYFRMDSAQQAIWTQVRGIPDTDCLCGRLMGVKLELDPGRANYPNVMRLLVDLGTGVITVRLWAVREDGRRLTFDLFADRALRTLAALRPLQSCQARIAVDKQSLSYGAFADAEGKIRVPAPLRSMSPEQILDNA